MSYSSFSAEAVPEYDKRVQEQFDIENQEQGLIKEQLAENRQQRKANSELLVRAQNSVFNLSPKLAKLAKD